MQLIGHYKSEVNAQTNLATKLQDEIRAREEFERVQRERTCRHQATWIDEDELRSKEQEYIAIIDLLEDEIQALNEDKMKQAQEFERQSLVHRANVKQSFLQDMDIFRSQISGAVCGEVQEALADTIADNERLTRDFRLLLGETEQLQASRDRKDRALSRTKRELGLLRHEHELKTSERSRGRHKEGPSALPATPASTPCEESPCEKSPRENEEIDDDVSDRKHEGPALEEYFRQCIKSAKYSR
jgi:hypothetical protein